MSAEPDYYDLLQVPFDAESKEIIATYRRLARQYHPDIAKDPAATERMLALNRAIEVLGDTKRRREYDARRLQARAREALARKSAESESTSTPLEGRATTDRQSTEPRLTRAIATRNTEVGWRTRAIARRPESKRTPARTCVCNVRRYAWRLDRNRDSVAVYLGDSSGEVALVQPTTATGASPPIPPSTPAASSGPLSTESPFPHGSDVFESRGIWLVGADMTPGI